MTAGAAAVNAYVADTAPPGTRYGLIPMLSGLSKSVLNEDHALFH